MKSFYVIFLLLVLISCSFGKKEVINSGDKKEVINSGNKIEKICSNGGRVSWYKGDKHELIAYDSITDNTKKNTDLFTMLPDGSDKKCITSNSGIPKGFIGQPEWYSDGEYIVIQAENTNSAHTLYNHMAWGINQDLWIIKRDGTGVELIYQSPLNHAVLHPHFNNKGTKIIFAERIATGKPLWILKKLTPGGENPWDGWQIHIADFDINKKGMEKLSNHKILKPNGNGFYETHGYTSDEKIIYSYTAGGENFIDDIYIADMDGKNVKNLTESPKTWDEHGHFSPSGNSLAFMSSRFDPTWVAPKSDARTLRTELYLKNNKGEIKQLTEMNKNGKPDTRYIISDFDWDKQGKRIVFESGEIGPWSLIAESPEIWIITFPEAQ